MVLTHFWIGQDSAGVHFHATDGWHPVELGETNVLFTVVDLEFSDQFGLHRNFT